MEFGLPHDLCGNLRTTKIVIRSRLSILWRAYEAAGPTGRSTFLDRLNLKVVGLRREFKKRFGVQMDGDGRIRVAPQMPGIYDTDAAAWGLTKVDIRGNRLYCCTFGNILNISMSNYVCESPLLAG